MPASPDSGTPSSALRPGSPQGRPEPRAARRRPSRRGEGSALRDEIIAAATQEIARTGDAGALTLRGVARAVGVAATSIYLHFDSVEKLVDEVKLTRFDQFSHVLRDAADAAGTDPAVRLLARAHGYVAFWRDHPGEYAVMFAARMHLGSVGAPRPFRLKDALEAVAEDLARVWGEPVAPDRPVSQEVSMCAFHLWSGLHGMLSLRMLRPHLLWPDLDAEVADLVNRLVRSGPVGSGPVGSGPVSG